MKMKKTIYLMFALFLASLALAANLSDYPKMFIDDGSFDAYIVVDNKAPALHVILQSKLINFFTEYTGNPISGRAKLASEIRNLDQNLIILGDPCQSDLFGLMEDYTVSCGHFENKAGIFLVEYGDYYHVIVTGTDDDIKRSVDDLLNYKKKDIDGTEYDVREIEAPYAEEQETDDSNEQSMIEELNRKIANNSAQDLPVEQTTQTQTPQNSENIQIAKVVIQEDDKNENLGLLPRIISWLKRLFS